MTYAAQVPHANLDGHARASLVTAGQVVGEPGNDTRESRIDCASRDEDTAVHDFRVRRRDAPIEVSFKSQPDTKRWLDAHGKADGHDAHQRDHERAALPYSVGAVGDDDGQDGGRDVNRDGHELRGTRFVAQVLDDRRQEKADAVQRADNLSSLM